MERVSISKYLYETKKFTKKFDKYLHELGVINEDERNKIKLLKENNLIKSTDEYFSEYVISVNEFNKRRENLKQKYGKYSDIYACPYYCIATNADHLFRIFEGETSGNYKYCKEYLEKWTGKMVQDECRNDEYGYFVGMGFMIDDIYFVIKNPKTKKLHFSLNIKEYDINDHRSYRLVTNDKGYI
jgi:hypothetical protein